ncbi:ABC-type sugar transport system, periplasmic component [Hahella chejuensis KCTC 2396]|uniref:ABC-type sugar transport system, periplasmic component n=1 Tax=Hahella chejuensis (strain KCTC 2396) TaxID=349521 RepID=Q2S866_HAHCH|nr:ABC transporter substrate-binding protein [Hahella chejuensis]ABC33158.1 ABC-type sugar transport system, periplasmic component [Hahella chejuensis KCTC 2396]
MIYRVLLAMCGLLIWLPAAAEPLKLGVGLLTASGDAREGVIETVRRFEALYPGAKVEVIAKYDEEFKLSTLSWLEKGGDNAPDIYFGSAGERLYRLVRKDLVADISAIWNKEKLDEQFKPGIKASVSHNGQVYAIPFAYYQWGLYYNALTLVQYNLEPPQTWSELLKVCGVLKQHNVYCFGIGTKDFWPAAGWFDYIDLRLNGLAFHQALTRGCVPYWDRRVVKAMRLWAELINAGYFSPGAAEHDWRDVFPEIYRGKTVFTLTGNFAETALVNIPERVKEAIRFLPFPRIADNMPNYEDAPTDIFFLSKAAANKPYANELIAFLARPDIQELLTSGLFMIPVNIKAQAQDTYFVKEGLKVLHESDGFAQFFDRDTPKSMADDAIRIFSQFIEHGDVERAVNALEKARIDAYQGVHAAVDC